MDPTDRRPPPLFLEVVAGGDVIEQRWVLGCPAGQLPSPFARSGIVQRDEKAEIAEVLVGLLGGDALHRDVQHAADGSGDLEERDPLLGGSMQPRAGWS